VKKSKGMKLNKSSSRLHSLLNLIAPSFDNFRTCLKQVDTANKSGTGNNWVLVNDSLLQIPLDLGEKSRIDDAAKNSYSIGTIHIRLAIHVFHQGTCDDNNLIR
jgi:hypothetical protein